MKLGIKPYQNLFSLVASKMPLPASAKPSNHFLQFIFTIVTHKMDMLINIISDFVKGDVFGFWDFTSVMVEGCGKLLNNKKVKKQY